MNLYPKRRSGKINLTKGKVWIPNFKYKMSTANSPRSTAEIKIPVSNMFKCKHKQILLHFSNLDTLGRIPSFSNNVKDDRCMEITMGNKFSDE